MDDADRQVLRRCRVQLVSELQVANLWDALLTCELFQPDMIEDIQRAGSGSRRDQARQLVTDLETRGSRALPLFISCLEDTGQHSLASLLRSSSQTARRDPEAIRHLNFKPVAVRPEELRAVKQDPSKPAPGAHETQRGNPDLAYILNADPCGYCLIINNVNFCRKSGLSTRTGSHVDCEKLQRRFRLLHFAVEVESDLTAARMLQALEELARRDHGALDCCVVVILSHGRQASHLQFPGAVYGTDGSAVSVEKIVNLFNGTRCPSLGGKPKLFFIQACGGEKKDQGFEVVSASPADRAPGGNPEPDALPFQDPAGGYDQPDAVSSLPTPSDIFVSYSTFPASPAFLLPKALSPGGTPRAAPGTSRPWMAFWSSGLTRTTCRASCSGSLTPCRRKGLTSRFLGVLISSGKNSSLKLHDARAADPA